MKEELQIISAPSILGLKPTGVEGLADSLLAAGLAEKLSIEHPVTSVPTLNALYQAQRDPKTQCLNAQAIRDFSVTLGQTLADTLDKKRFALVLGGDCSILIGILSALKAKGNYGLVFLDAHADFYLPEQSPTGEVADMDLAIVTGRGPDLLTDLYCLQPYVKEEHVIHVGQRDGEETQRYGAKDIRETAIKCFDLAAINQQGMALVADEVLAHLASMAVSGFWLHFDTDVLSDDLNPAVDYRLPGGLQFEQVELLIQGLLATGRLIGMSITILNPSLDSDGRIARRITDSLVRAFEPGK